MAAEAEKDAKISATWEEYRSLSQATTIEQFTVFTLDRGTTAKNPQLASEIAAYNARVDAAASEAGKVTVSKQLLGHKFDTAFGLLIRKLVPEGLRGFILAAILGAVVSSLASMLNAASTIFTMDFFNKYIQPNAAQGTLVLVGRSCVIVFAVTGCLIAPFLNHPALGGIFTYIQEFQGFISPGILAVFVFGFAVKRVPGFCGVVGLLINPFIYFLLKYLLPNLAFLDRMAVSFFCVLALMGVLTALFGKSVKPKELPRNTEIALETSTTAKMGGIAVVVVTLALYAIFW
jgi:SSS family solute:Na+ symporter